MSDACSVRAPQSCLSLRDPVDCNLPDSSVQELSKPEHWTSLPLPPPRDPPYPGIRPMPPASPAWEGRCLTTEPPEVVLNSNDRRSLREPY